jgi:hypothetical protein
MTKLGSGALAACFLLACGSDPPPGASLGLDKTLPDSPLTRLQTASLIRAGDGFVLAGYEAGQVRWGGLGLDGTVTHEGNFPLPTPVVGPVFAATMKTVPGDQLVAIAVVPSLASAEGYDLTATVQTAGMAAPAQARVLASLPPGTDPTTIQVAAGAAASGRLGWVAWGVRVPGIPVRYLTLPADALASATASTFLADAVAANVPAWDCLAAHQRPTGFSFGAVVPNGDPDWPASNFETVEVDEAGGTTLMRYQLMVTIANCQIVGGPNPSGSYFMAMQGILNGTRAIDFATYYPPIDPKEAGTVHTQHPVMPDALFGDPLSMPKPAWVSRGGPDVVIGLSHRSGHQVVRFQFDAVKHGATLDLRSASGNSGPIAAWVGDDATYVTYSDQAGSGSGAVTRRYFMRVDSPATLP